MTQPAIMQRNAEAITDSAVFQASMSIIEGISTPDEEGYVVQFGPREASGYHIDPRGIGRVTEWSWRAGEDLVEKPVDLRTWMAHLALLDSSRKWSPQDLNLLASLTRVLVEVSAHG